MEEIEVPTEHLHEEINEKAEELKKEQKWSLYVAISTALMAVLAAVSSMQAGHHSNEAVIEQIKASDQWAFYQAKSIKSEIRAIHPTDSTKTPAVVKQEEDAIRAEATADELNSRQHLEKHIILARAVTLLQIAIAISAVSILTRRKFLWLIGIMISLIGVGFLVSGLL